MSAITLTWAGRLIDYTTTRRFTLAVTLCCSGLPAGFRRTGGVDAVHRVLLSAPRRRGLMVHTALTATARQFPLDAGKALGAIALGLSLAQAVFL